MKYLITTIAAVVLVGCGEPKRKPTSILDAVDLRNIEAVKQYITAGTDVNTKDEDGRTALHLAAYNGHTEIAKLLLANNADVNVMDAVGQTQTALHIAAWQGHPEIAKLLLANNADVNVMDAVGQTPLNIAAGNGDTELVELLIAKGADVNAKTRSERTPLHPAAIGGHKKVVELLIAEGVDVNAQEKYDGTTPLDLAIAFEHTETANLLRKRGGKTRKQLEAAGN